MILKINICFIVFLFFNWATLRLFSHFSLFFIPVNGEQNDTLVSFISHRQFMLYVCLWSRSFALIQCFVSLQFSRKVVSSRFTKMTIFSQPCQQQTACDVAELTWFFKKRNNIKLSSDNFLEFVSISMEKYNWTFTHFLPCLVRKIPVTNIALYHWHSVSGKC